MGSLWRKFSSATYTNESTHTGLQLLQMEQKKVQESVAESVEGRKCSVETLGDLLLPVFEKGV